MFVFYRIAACLCLVVFVAPMSSVQAASSELCADSKSTAEHVSCLKTEHESLQTRLNETFAELVSGAEDDQAGQLKETQQAWVAYRDLQCSAHENQVENPSLKRVESLECMAHLTAQRIVSLSGIVQEEPESQIGVLPRWMNVLGHDHGDVSWHYADRLALDLDCDGDLEYVMTGIKVDTQESALTHVLAIAESAMTGKPKTDIFEFSVKQQKAELLDGKDENALALCASNFDVFAIDIEHSESKEPASEDAQQCHAQLGIADHSCFSAVLSLNEATSPSPKYEIIGEDNSQDGDTPKDNKSSEN